MKTVGKICFRMIWSLIDGAGLWLCFYIIDMFREVALLQWSGLSLIVHTMAKSVIIRNEAERDMFGSDTILPAPEKIEGVEG